MTSRSLALSTLHRSQIAAAAVAAHPEECCGILLGRPGAGHETVVERVCPAANASSADRRRHFEIDPAVILGTWRQGRSRGWTLVGFYHSHPDGGCRPSGSDARDAWPDVSYLIVAGQGAMASWRREASGGFVAEAMTEVPAPVPAVAGARSRAKSR